DSTLEYLGMFKQRCTDFFKMKSITNIFHYTFNVLPLLSFMRQYIHCASWCSHTHPKTSLKYKTTQKLSSLPVNKERELTRVATLVDVFCHIRSSQLTPAKRLFLLLMFNIEPKECLFIRPICENVFSHRHLLSLHMHSNYFFL